MQRYLFSMEVSGLDDAEDYEAALFEAGCDDALVLKSDGRLLVDFEREGLSFDDAVATARASVVLAGGWVLRVTPTGAGVSEARGLA